jgi:FAD/FMN-containing dehydrogenase/Fe-S oxidoreductase
MYTEKCRKIARETGLDLRCDDMTRQMFATDASLHQLVPAAVAFPKGTAEAAAIMAACVAEKVPVTARGSGSGLAGAALGDGLVVDFSRYNRGISAFDPEKRTVRVQAGVVLDQLNAFLQPHGLTFGPDVATSSRATLGGMIANDSSGARAPIYGTTISHVQSIEAVMADGTVAELRPGALPRIMEPLDRLIAGQAQNIRERFHDGICKRWPGYGVDRYLRVRDMGPDPVKLMGGSEGTLALLCFATLRLMPLPKSKGLGLIFFDKPQDAFDASLAVRPLKPAAIENIDDTLFGQTRGQRAFQAARDLLELDGKPCGSILIVEFYEDEQEKLPLLEGLGLGLRTRVFTDPREMALVWNLRKSGLSLLTGCPGPAKPAAGIEDMCVPPERLPEYTKELQKLIDGAGFHASFYGHVGAGLLHVRPMVDMHKGADIKRFRKLSEDVADLVSAFKGSIVAEHGVGIAHTEFVAGHIGPEMMSLMQRIKTAFDPKNLLNPGKILDDGRYKMDTNLRQGDGAEITLPFEPVLEFAAKDHSFVGSLEQCNGCGGCRKDAPVMCPTFQATGEELMSTRGRANLIRAVLEGRITGPNGPLLAEELEQALSNCIACRGCGSECPSNVNLPLLKAELVHARQQKHGVPLGARVFSRVDLLGAAGCLVPFLANAMLEWKPLRRVMKSALGISEKRPLPRFASQRFDRWFKRRPRKSGTRGRVILWDDCFVNCYEPNIGKAAVRVLEAAGYEVVLPEGRACCGRPAFSMGRLDVVRDFGNTNLALLRGGSEPILFLEPSCYSMFREDYRELKLDGAEAVAERVVLFEEFIDTLLAREPEALVFNGAPARAAIHAHCHSKALTDTAALRRLAEKAPNASAVLLDTGCCGMAGAFGALDAKYDLSLAVASPLVEKVNALAADTDLIASGTSCRHQITHLTAKAPLHFAEWLAARLK